MIAAFLARYAIAGLAAALLAALLGLGVQSYRLKSLQADTAEAVAKASEKARLREQEWGLIVREIDDAKETQLRAVAADRDAALIGLRNRPRNRLPEAATASCAGASPAALSAEDAAVAIRLAGEADELRAEYAACRAYVAKIGR